MVVPQLQLQLWVEVVLARSMVLVLAAGHGRQVEDLGCPQMRQADSAQVGTGMGMDYIDWMRRRMVVHKHLQPVVVYWQRKEEALLGVEMRAVVNTAALLVLGHIYLMEADQPVVRYKVTALVGL